MTEVYLSSAIISSAKWRLQVFFSEIPNYFSGVRFYGPDPSGFFPTIMLNAFLETAWPKW